jgi:uncharacterized membrane protein required for colicin V production
MHWFDWLALGIVVVVTILQTVRGVKAEGMGLPFFEAVGLVVSAVTSVHLSGPVAQALHMQKGTVMIIIFLILGVLSFVLARWLFSLTAFSFQSLDGFFSLLFGLAAGWTIANMVLRIIIESQGMNGEVATLAASSPVAREVYSFRTWNALMRLLFRAKLGPDFNPDIG